MHALLTHSLDAESRHELIPKFATQLPQFRDWQILEQPWDCCQGD